MLMAWARMQSNYLPALRWLAAVPNGGWRNRVTAARLKAEGVSPGVPDLMLLYPCGGFHGLFIELKRKRGGQVSQEQHVWIDYLNSVGFLALVCKGEEEARLAILRYLGADGK